MKRCLPARFRSRLVLAKLGLQKLVGNKLFAVASLGGTTLLAGGMAALREKIRLQDERRHHIAGKARGEKFA